MLQPYIESATALSDVCVLILLLFVSLCILINLRLHLLYPASLHYPFTTYLILLSQPRSQHLQSLLCISSSVPFMIFIILISSCLCGVLKLLLFVSLCTLICGFISFILLLFIYPLPPTLSCLVSPEVNTFSHSYDLQHIPSRSSIPYLTVIEYSTSRTININTIMF